MEIQTDDQDKIRGVQIWVPPYPSVCQIAYCLDADNEGGGQTVWAVIQIENGDLIDKNTPITQMVKSPAPEKAYQVTVIEIPLEPDFFYLIWRDNRDAEDTALGDDTIEGQQILMVNG